MTQRTVLRVLVVLIVIVILLIFRSVMPATSFESAATRADSVASQAPIEQPDIPQFGDVSLNLEYATTTAAREKGLGGRTSLAPDEAMLFVFPKDDLYGFWMKDTLVPLDIFWLDDQGHVVYLAENVATSSYPNVFYPTVPARYVLETVAGFANAHGVATGTPLLLKNLPTVSE